MKLRDYCNPFSHWDNLDLGGGCTKCGFLEYSVEYVSKKCRNYDTDGTYIYPEHLDCVCLVCGYKWQMKCKDAK